MFYLTKKKMMSAIEPHMKCIEPLKKLNLDYIWIPYLVIKDDDKYYFSELKYRETTYKVYDRDEPTVEFDFEFSYNNEHIEEHNVHYMEIAYQKWMQVYKDAVFEKDDIKDMYLVFYKNRRHNGNEIYDVSVYYNMKKVIELKDFSMFCDENSDMDFQNFTYTKILEGGFEETWRVTDYINEELVDRYDPWEDAKQKRAEEEAEVDEIFSMDYEELKHEYFQHEKEIRKKMYSMIEQANECIDSEDLIDEEEMQKAFQKYISRNTKRIEPPSSAGTATYELTKLESNNDKCMVFENGVITDYIHLSTNTEAEWNRDDYRKASHYAEDCRYIKLDGVLFDLFNPQDIMNIPIGEGKIDEHLFETYKGTIGYNKYDLRRQRIRETETDKFNSEFWTNTEIEKLANMIKEQDETAAIDAYICLAYNYCKGNGLLLTKSDLYEIVEYHVFVVKKYVVDNQDEIVRAPDWCIEYLRTINPELECEPLELEDDETEVIMDFWDYDRLIDFAKMMQLDGLETAIEHFWNLASEYCEERQVEIDPEKFIEYFFDMIGNSEDDDDDDDDDYDDEDDDYEEDDDDYDDDEFDDEDDDYEEDYDDDDESYELYELLQSRTTGCFEPALLVPLAHITINMAIKDGDVAYGCERIVAQLVANGEDEYGKMLDAELSKRDEYWDESKSVSYGITLKNWAINAREYHWLSGNFPDLVPKTKGAYSTAKKKKTQRYLELKQLAESHGYQLDDHTCDNSCW